MLTFISPRIGTWLGGIVLVAVLAGCGGGGGGGDGTDDGAGGGRGEPTPDTTTVHIAHAGIGSAQTPYWFAFPDVGILSDERDGSLWTTFIWIDVSSFSPSTTIHDATLIVPATEEWGKPATVGLILVDGEGRDEPGPPVPSDVFGDFDHEVLDYLEAPVPQAGKPPVWRAEATAAVQDTVAQGKQYALFRLRVSGLSLNDADDGYCLCGLWEPTQLKYVATLRVTYGD